MMQDLASQLHSKDFKLLSLDNFISCMHNEIIRKYTSK